MFVTLGSGGKFGSRGERVRCCAGMAPDARLGRAVGAERPMDVAIAGVEAWRGRRVPDPCCCVSEIVEIKRPIPTVVIKYKPFAKNKSGTLPRTGISNQKTLIRVTKIIFTKPRKMDGMVLPKMNSNGLIGVTTICSIVPISFSRTTDILVNKSETNMTIAAITPGT